MVVKIIVGLVLLGLVYFKGMAIYSNSMNPELGLLNDKLRVCSSKPNCVSTTSETEQHQITPISTTKDINSIIKVIEENFSAKAMGLGGNYAHFVIKTSLMGYVDDLEIHLQDGMLFVRSASRVGHSDLGANRKRVEILRNLLK